MHGCPNEVGYITLHPDTLALHIPVDLFQPHHHFPQPISQHRARSEKIKKGSENKGRRTLRPSSTEQTWAGFHGAASQTQRWH